MNKSLLSITAAALLIGAGVASAQTTTATTTTWMTAQGTTFTKYSAIQRFNSFTVPTLQPTVGTVLPPAVTVYPLPDTMKIETPDSYRYTIINGRPVVVEAMTRKVVHNWE